ncbi:MAG: sugar porter family MFS transporter [Bacteroidia bacterium]|nr:sugar porter family MFS transporter [Bacteroidia bacterium]
MKNTSYIIRTALTVALGGFLFGFDAVVISGVNSYIISQWGLGDLELGWAVASLTLIASVTMFLVGPLSDRIGRKKVLAIGAVAFAISALGSALAPNYLIFVMFRMLGGVGVGAALVIGPLYIAEISPGNLRGRMVSFNQLNIVIAFTVAYFTNLMIRNMIVDDSAWRWMLGLEVVPAVLFFFALFFVPESPRWLLMQNRDDEALDILKKANGDSEGETEMKNIKDSIAEEANKPKSSLRDVFAPAMKKVMFIGIVIAVLQQITGINSVFFYANMIFEQSGIGTDAAFTQAVFVGIINLVFTLVAMAVIDRLGRRPLMIIGVAGIVVSMFFLSYQFGQAGYNLTSESISTLDTEIQEKLQPVLGQSFEDDVDFKNSMLALLGEDVMQEKESSLISAAISINPILVLMGILSFVASFAISLGPVMWVLLSELFPNRIRGIAISVAAGINSVVSFLVQLIFPWELANLGTSLTFLIYGIFGIIGLALILRSLPETKGKSLEELEEMLVN